MATNPSSTSAPRLGRSFASRSLPILAFSALCAAGIGCGSDPETSSTGGSGTTSSTTSGNGGTGGSGGGPTTCSSTESGTATGSGDANVLAGTFQIQLNEPKPGSNGNPDTPGSTTVLGKVYDGPYPAQLVWELDSQDGDCKLVKPRVPFCSTPCGGTAVCVEDETCQDYPTAHGAGLVTLEGVTTTAGAAGVTMCPVANNYQVPTGTTLNYPAFDEGAAVTLHADGDYYPAFDIAGKGIAELVITSDTIDLKADQPIMLTWTKASDSAASSIHVKLDISHHGGTKGQIECDAADTGSLTITGALVTKLLALGVAGYPTILVTRQSTTSTTIPVGRVDLTLLSTVERTVTIEGLVSCTSDTDCPQGQTCQTDLTCK